MKKSKKMIIGIILIVVGAIGISGSILGGVLVIGAGVVLILLDKKSKNVTDISQTQPPTPTPKKEETPDGEKDYNLLPNYVNGMFCCYEYEQKICFIKEDNIEEKFSYVIGNGGKQLLFEFEPNNQYNSMAIAIYLDDKKLGYVYNGQTQEMIHDFHRKGWEICAHINKYSTEDMTASYKIGFYKPVDCFENKQFTLTKTSKKIDEYTNRADNLSYCDEGDLLLIEKEFLEDNYIVTTDSYDEIGELPQSAVNFIEEYNPKKIYGIFNSYEEDENGKLKANITVYLI